MNAISTREIHILMVEDNPADVVFFREALRETRIAVKLHVSSTGEEAMQFLLAQAPFGDRPRPDVIVMDLNVPVKNGREVLEEMMVHPTLRTIPVAILSTSDVDSHVCDRYSTGLCRYFVKTDDLCQFQEITRKIVAHAGVAHAGVE